jgi:hypothetical protein
MHASFAPRFALGALLCCASITLASPRLIVDKTTFECGRIDEGAQEKIVAPFIIKNRGDKPLKIENVRPSCGCTVVAYDTLIAPGKSGSIKPEVNLRGFSGAIKKTVTVTSNDPSQPTVQLVISATIQPIIGVSETYLTTSASQNPAGTAIILSTAKKDLAIKTVSFTARTQEGPEWQSSIPLSIRSLLTPLDSATGDGMRYYRLVLQPPQSSGPQSGEYTMVTNHPQKKELKIRGRIER